MRASLREIAPLSALKIGAILSACVFIAWMVAAALIYIFLGIGGVWDRMNNLLADLIGADSISAGLYFGVAAGVGGQAAVGLSRELGDGKPRINA